MTSFSKSKLVHFVAMIAVVAGVVGCSRSPEEQAAYEKERAEAEAKAEYKKTHPEVKVIGTFDGCEVKFYERGYTTENFYIAKCVNSESTTTTSSFDRVGGKFSHDQEKFSVTQEVSKAKAKADFEVKKAEILQKQELLKKKMEEEVAKLKAKQDFIENAKKKLTAEEKEALGIK